jgi:hypothetical protein
MMDHFEQYLKEFYLSSIFSVGIKIDMLDVVTNQVQHQLYEF